MGHHDRRKHYHAGAIFLFNLAAFCLLISSTQRPIYQYSSSVISFTTTEEYYLDGVYWSTNVADAHYTYYWTNSSAPSNQRELFQTLQSVNIVATIVTGVVWAGLALRCFCKCFPKFIRRIVKWAIFIATVISPIVTLLAWVILFEQPRALTKDCTPLSLHLSCAYTPFKESFYGDRVVTPTHIIWGPQIAWWLTISAFVLCLFGAALIIHGRKRYKYSRI